MIVKNGDIDYWRQIEASFRSSCQEKGLEAYYYSTTSEAALAAAKEGELVPAFFITGDNLLDPNVKPFLEYYKK